jgi:imidazolonepropionase-like amidohydrolase
MAALSGLLSYQNSGMPPIDVIRTATINAAELIGLANQVGSIEAGKFADIIGFSGDLLADTSELRRVRFVMKGGQVIRKP